MRIFQKIFLKFFRKTLRSKVAQSYVGHRDKCSILFENTFTRFMATKLDMVLTLGRMFRTQTLKS